MGKIYLSSYSDKKCNRSSITILVYHVKEIVWSERSIAVFFFLQGHILLMLFIQDNDTFISCTSVVFAKATMKTGISSLCTVPTATK